MTLYFRVEFKYKTKTENLRNTIKNALKSERKKKI